MEKAPETLNKKRSASRVGAIQSLYSAKIADLDIYKVMSDFVSGGCMVEMDDVSYPAQQDLYNSIVSGVLNRNEEIVSIANSALTSRPIEKQDVLIGYILKAGIFEIIDNADIDAKLIVSEYVDIAHSFYEPKEAGMVNGVLDNVRRAVRG